MSALCSVVSQVVPSARELNMSPAPIAAEAERKSRRFKPAAIGRSSRKDVGAGGVNPAGPTRPYDRGVGCQNQSPTASLLHAKAMHRKLLILLARPQHSRGKSRLIR